MKKTRKTGFLTLIAGVMLAFSFTACGNGGDDNNGGGGTAPTITTTSLANGTVGTAYSQKLNASGDTPITWSIESGSSLPGGLTLNTTTGVISGNPTTANKFDFTVKATNAAGFKTKSLSITIASGSGGSSTYIITGSGTSFTAAKNGATVGTANQDIETVITAIRTDANGSNCTIQFGNGTNVLDLGIGNGDFQIGNVKFNNDGGTWGIVTITGKITSANNSCTIRTNGPSVVSTADIANTHVSGGNAIYNTNAGTVTISGGTVSAKNAAIYSDNGTTTISGGTISSNTYAIYISDTGTITIHDPPVVINGNTYGTINWVPPK